MPAPTPAPADRRRSRIEREPAAPHAYFLLGPAIGWLACSTRILHGFRAAQDLGGLTAGGQGRIHIAHTSAASLRRALSFLRGCSFLRRTHMRKEVSS